MFYIGENGGSYFKTNLYARYVAGLGLKLAISGLSQITDLTWYRLPYTPSHSTCTKLHLKKLSNNSQHSGAIHSAWLPPI